jgi:ATP synthase protein I
VDIAIRQVQANAKKVVLLQLILATVIAAVFAIAENGWSALSALYGGLASLAVSWMLRRGVLKANEIARDDPKRGMTVLYIGAVQRFVLVVALLGLGLGLLKLTPLATVVGFGGAQLAYAVVMRRTAHPASR